MGLSTLYQLRGRVGRSNRIAYAYLMYRPDKSLTEVSEKRLEAIKGFTELGSGFKIDKKNGTDKKREKGDAELILQIDAYLPDEYISDERHKIEIYKRIRQIDNRVNYEELQDELIDRFGEYPDVVAYLLEIGLAKAYLDKVFVNRVERRNNKLVIQFEKISQQLFLTQDYFQALSQTSLKDKRLKRVTLRITFFLL